MAAQYTSDDKDKQLYSQDKVDVLPTLENGEYGAPSHNAFDQAKGEELSSSLLPRHLSMISIGGVIGTGLVSSDETTSVENDPCD